MRSLAFLLAAVLAAGFAMPPAYAGAPRLANIGRIDGLRDIFLRDGAVVVRAEAGDYEVARLPGGKLALAPVAPPEAVPVPSDIIPHARVIEGTRNIRAAWLAGPTKRYGHGVLGDAVEASALKVETVGGDIVSLELGEDSVFEDLTPRIADLDGDGRDEIIVVRSYQGRGAAVAVYRLAGGKLVWRAESDPIGQAFRWLNPAGAGDFDGDGRMEIAVVRTPHIGGILILYRIAGDRLVEIARRPGFSTHAMGSTVLDMAAVLDLNGDGAADVVLPDQAQKVLKAMSYANGEFKTLWSIPNDARIVTSVLVSDIDGKGLPDLVYGLADGRVMLIAR
jgi:hypothetical protein